MAGAFSGMVQGTKAISKRLVFAYAIDWIVVLAFALLSYGFTYIEPHFRAFSPSDLSISFPHSTQTISIATAVGACVLAPATIIVVVVLLLVPGPAAWRRMTGGEIFRIKIWEMNVGLLGLALAQATQSLLVQGMKNLAGNPRPDLLDRCQPDLSNVKEYAVGSYAADISSRWVLVTRSICTQTDRVFLNDGFKSFPSGHNATAFAGMLYLSLYLASKFGTGFPTLPFHKRNIAGAQAEKRALTAAAAGAGSNGSKSAYRDYREFGYRDEAAAAPTWTLGLVYVPLGVAIYIGGTRYFDYWHHGVDVLAGTIIGVLSGWIGFRWYHGPVGRSAGWAWSPRSRDRAFGIGVGTLGYVTDSHNLTEPRGVRDVELGGMQAEQPLDPGYRPTWHQRGEYDSLGSSAYDERLHGRANA